MNYLKYLFYFITILKKIQGDGKNVKQIRNNEKLMESI
nr:MAG TPA: hypothetical protein [Caudoviricetes sp.]